MNPAVYAPILAMLAVILAMIYRRRLARRTVIRSAIKRKRHKERPKMKTLAERFLGKECLVYTFNDNQLSGVLKEMTDGAILVDNGRECEAVNLDYVVRIREYPKTKNGKKKSVVVD